MADVVVLLCHLYISIIFHCYPHCMAFVLFAITWSQVVSNSHHCYSKEEEEEVKNFPRNPLNTSLTRTVSRESDEVIKILGQYLSFAYCVCSPPFLFLNTDRLSSHDNGKVEEQGMVNDIFSIATP